MIVLTLGEVAAATGGRLADGAPVHAADPPAQEDDPRGLVHGEARR